MTDSITVCPLTSDPTEALFRVPIDPNPDNGLRSRSCIMADKIVSIQKGRLRILIGDLDDDDIIRLNRAIFVFLGLAG